jgi:predicted dehydrogenase
VANRGSARAKRFAVLGWGSIGKRHIANLQQLGAENIIACDTEPDRRRAAAQYGIQAVASAGEVWSLEPEVCLITTPTASHLSLALEAAAHGCHLFIEKPLAHKWQGVDQLVDEVERRKLITLIGCNLRFHPGLRAVKRLLAENAIGRVIAVRAEVGQYLPDWHPAEDYRKNYSARRALGGGIILDAIHEIDYVRWLLGEVEDAVCFAGKLSRLEIDTEDTAAILLRFESGAIGEVHLDYVQRAHSRSCQVIGEEGTIRWDYTAGKVRWYAAEKREWQVAPDAAGRDANQMYLDEMAHFLRCLDGLEKSESSVSDGARVLKIALAAKTSAREQRLVNLGESQWSASAAL